MFTGIVEETGTIKAMNQTSITIAAKLVLQDTRVQESIAVDGTCLTVIDQGEDWFTVDVIPETLRRTRFATLLVGDSVNLERSVQMNGRLGGHLVQGHIEAVTQVVAMTPEGNGLLASFALPSTLSSLIIQKGFVTLNGVSLTVADITATTFSVALIPYTRQHTNLGQLTIGSFVNVESDIIGRYVLQHLASQQTSSSLT